MKEQIKELLDEGKNYSQIGEILGIHRTTVSKIAKNNGFILKKTIHINCVICDISLGENKRNRSKCKTCSTRLRRLRLKKKAVDYLGGECERCGYDENLAALTFHHKNPNEKEFNIGIVKHKSWDFIKPELDKCELLCSNCHLVEHSKYDDPKLLKYL